MPDPIYYRPTSEKEAEALDSIAKKYRQSRSDIIRHAVSRFLNEVQKKGEMTILPEESLMEQSQLVAEDPAPYGTVKIPSKPLEQKKRAKSR